MPLFKPPNQSYRWLLAELTIIVLGILIAFQVEEWRTERSERIDEEIALVGLLQDLENDRQNIERILTIRERQRSGADNFAEYLQQGAQKGAREIAELFLSVTRSTTYIPASATYTGLRETNRLHIISDELIRNEIHSYFENWQSNTVSLQNILIGDAWNEFISAASRDIFFASSSFEGNGIEVISGAAGGTTSVTDVAVVVPLNEIPRNPLFLASIGQFRARVANGNRGLLAMREKNDDLRTLIEQLLD